MKRKYFAYAILTAILTSFYASAQHLTYNPEVEEASVSDVLITKVEITEEHTAVYLRYVNETQEEEVVPQQVPPGFRGFRRPKSSAPQIWLDPNTRLYKPGDVNTKFKFLKAEGIPTNPTRKTVEDGEEVEFVAYFEPVTPGIEIIDFYEGRSGPQTRAWNFYGIHINNPAPGKSPSYPEKSTESGLDVVPVSTPGFPAGFSGFRGNVLNANTGEPIPATITYGENGDTISLNTGSGKFKIGLEAGKGYIFRASAPGFAEEVWELDGSADSTSSFFEHDFRLMPLREGTSFILSNIYFETSSHTLLSESFDELDQFVRIMRDNPTLRIRVEGHTDNVGDFEKNVALSRDRAESVKSYLVKKGVEQNRIETKGYGSTRPNSKGNSEEERRQNRRVEIVIISSV